MIRIPWLAATVALAASACLAGADGAQPRAGSPLGVNLHKVRHYSTELSFVDVFRMSTGWVSNAEGVSWGEGGELDVDRDGWVRTLRPGQWAEVPLLTGFRGDLPLPRGEFTGLYEGDGQIEIEGAVIVDRGPGRIRFVVKPGARRLSLKLMRTSRTDPVRNIRVILPGFVETYATQPFHPAFIERWQRFGVLRFMDWMETNDSPIREWSERPRPDYWSQGTHRGVALEHMLDLANRLGAEPWFCMPHQASDGYIEAFAAMVRERLRPDLRVWVEYSNELWNGQFDQAEYVRSRGVALELTQRPYQAGLRYTARRSVEIFQIWEREFGGTERLVRVLPGQFSSPGRAREILGWDDAAAHADVYAVAPYFGGRLARKQGDRLRQLSVDALMTVLEEDLQQYVRLMRENAEVASGSSLALVAYEGGQHLRSARKDERLTELFIAANRHPRMHALYLRHLANWKSAGGRTFVHYSSTSRYGDTGMWGALERHGQDAATAPKYRALVDFIDANPRWW